MQPTYKQIESHIYIYIYKVKLKYSKITNPNNSSPNLKGFLVQKLCWGSSLFVLCSRFHLFAMSQSFHSGVLNRLTRGCLFFREEFICCLSHTKSKQKRVTYFVFFKTFHFIKRGEKWIPILKYQPNNFWNEILAFGFKNPFSIW